MNNEILEALFDRAKTIDILADNLKVLLDDAAQLGTIELVETTRILNKRGVKMGIMREYGESRRKYYALRQRAQRAIEADLLRPLPSHEAYDCLR